MVCETECSYPPDGFEYYATVVDNRMHTQAKPIDASVATLITSVMMPHWVAHDVASNVCQALHGGPNIGFGFCSSSAGTMGAAGASLIEAGPARSCSSLAIIAIARRVHRYCSMLPSTHSEPSPR
jgi:hypothetical protein